MFLYFNLKYIAGQSHVPLLQFVSKCNIGQSDVPLL